jgi:hypothetical protein
LARVLHRRLIGSLFPFLRFFLPLSYGLFFLNSKCIFRQDLTAPVPSVKSHLQKLSNPLMPSKEVSAQDLYSDIRTTQQTFSSPAFPRARRFSIITIYKHNNRLKGFRKSTKQLLNTLSSASCKAKTHASCLDLSKNPSMRRARSRFFLSTTAAQSQKRFQRVKQPKDDEHKDVEKCFKLAARSS